MPRITPIGEQDYARLIEDNLFYVDKTYFIKDWWEAEDKATLITRPRRFGKTLTMSMLNYFFSVKYAGRSDLFKNKKIWQYEKYPALQGTYPVINFSLLNAEFNNYKSTKEIIFALLGKLYTQYYWLKDEVLLNDEEKRQFDSIGMNMNDSVASLSLLNLSEYLYRAYKKKVIILLDEYDAPLQMAWQYHYWDEMLSFLRPFFNAAFKANSFLERAILTGVTRVSKESLFSDMNNLKVISTTSEKYADVFGFTQEEVNAVLDEYGKSQTEKEAVKKWYDGYTFGSSSNIYNPASIIGYLEENGKLKGYWINTGSSLVIADLFKKGDEELKSDLEILMNGGSLIKKIKEELVYSELAATPNAVWSLLVAAGYLTLESYDNQVFTLRITNYEVKEEFAYLMTEWFDSVLSVFNHFLQALCSADLEKMNTTLSKITGNTFGIFDITGTEPERFYHGFVLGLIAAFLGRFDIRSNRESGEGRYDVILKPLNKTQDDPIILEFKVDRRKRPSLKRTVAEALKQIEEKNYAQDLIADGFDPARIRKYGIAFNGKKVLVG